MRIAIDARLNAYRIGGIPQYTRQLATALAEMARDDTLITLQHREHHSPLVIAPNADRATLYTPPHHRWEQLTLPLELLRMNANIVHFPDFIAPRLRSCPVVITIHDLAFLHYPEILDDEARRYYGQIRECVQYANAIIAVSESTASDIVERLNVARERIDVIYEAVGSAFFPIPFEANEKRVIGEIEVQADTFLLFVSTLEPRKNLPTLLHALRICIDRHPKRQYKLLVVGARGWRESGIFEALRDLKLEDTVQFLGKVTDEELAWLYSACRIYANPSRYEGFGLPLLEALACGAACLASDTSSLPEIGGDAAQYLPADDATAWADAIIRLWSNQKQRSELGQRGIQRARQFSWARAARETLGVYRRVAR
jgi:glycosyltransferase involved in cell wall biosynthesis